MKKQALIDKTNRIMDRAKKDFESIMERAQEDIASIYDELMPSATETEKIQPGRNEIEAKTQTEPEPEPDTEPEPENDEYVENNGQGRVKHPETDRRLKQNEGSKGRKPAEQNA